MNYKEEYYNLRDLLERFYIASSAIDCTFPLEELCMGEDEYERHLSTFIEVEEYLGIE